MGNYLVIFTLFHSILALLPFFVLKNQENIKFSVTKSKFSTLFTDNNLVTGLDQHLEYMSKTYERGFLPKRLKILKNLEKCHCCGRTHLS